MAGNLTALFGRDAYNSYGHHLNSTPGIKLIEMYLAVGTVVHIITASRFTVQKQKSIAKSPFQVHPFCFHLCCSGTICRSQCFVGGALTPSHEISLLR
jgi:hypothetical protein